MKDPQITWYVVEDTTLTPYEEYYAGSFRPNDLIEITMQVWNNRWGQEDIKDITNAKVVVFFDAIEDSALLNLCSIKIDEGDFKPLDIQSYRGRINLGRILSGRSNMGLGTSINNFSTITLRFGPVSAGMKNALKSLFMDLEFDS